jgi:hypothetical protein
VAPDGSSDDESPACGFLSGRMPAKRDTFKRGTISDRERIQQGLIDIRIHSPDYSRFAFIVRFFY